MKTSFVAVLAVALGCIPLAAADLPAPAGKAAAALPRRVVETTQRQIQDYLGKADVKGIPLLDPAINWNVQSNWPDRFSFQGGVFRLDMRDLSGNGFKRLKSRAQARPSMTVSFWYVLVPGATDPRVKNFISPRATWTPGKRVADKHMMWGGWNDVGEAARDIFDYTFYPGGPLHKAHWQSRPTASGQWEVFDRNGKLVGWMNAKDCVWNGLKVERPTFNNSAEALYRTGG